MVHNINCEFTCTTTETTAITISIYQNKLNTLCMEIVKWVEWSKVEHF